jgi:hypothetical protein
LRGSSARAATSAALGRLHFQVAAEQARSAHGQGRQIVTGVDAAEAMP